MVAYIVYWVSDTKMQDFVFSASHFLDQVSSKRAIHNRLLYAFNAQNWSDPAELVLLTLKQQDVE